MHLDPNHVLIAFGLVVVSAAYFAGVCVTGWVRQTNRKLSVLERVHARFVYRYLHAVEELAELRALQEVTVGHPTPGDDDDDDPSDH